MSVTFLCLEGSHLFLRHAYDDHSFTFRESGAVIGNDVILALAGLEVYDRNCVFGYKAFNRCYKTIVNRPKKRWRRQRKSEVVVEKVTEASRGLQLGHIGM